ncbi:MAG: LTA synthase family protein [Clostridia bacterium]|nr:LTA synthase family protein [Clostridia bacterium]
MGFLTYYIFVAILLEIAMFLRLDLGVLPKYWLYDLSIILMIAGVIFIIPNHIIQAIVTAIMLGVQTVIFYVNFSLYSLYGDVFSFDMINLFKETAKAMTKDFSFIWFMIALIIAYIAILIGIIIIAVKRHKYPVSFRKNFSLVIVMMLLIIQGLSASTIIAQRNQVHATSNIVQADSISDSFLMDTSMLKLASMKTFGFFGYYTNNLLNTLTKINSSNAMLESAITYFNNGEVHDQTDSQMFGVDKGNNVIMVMMESLEWYAFSDGTYNSRILSDELTPNIYSLAQDGVIATEFFAKSKTNISEGIGFIGSYPVGKYMEQVTRHSNDEQYDFTLPNVLKDNGYSSAYFHTNESTYYDRHKTHTKLGFDNIYCWDYDEFGYDGGFDWGEWIKEEDFVWSALDYMIPARANKNQYGEDAENFFTFYTTVSTHGPYDNNSKCADQQEYKDYVIYGDTRDLPKEQRRYTNWYSNMINAYGHKSNQFINRLINYQATVVGLDKAIGVLIQRLKDYGIYDNTTIVLYSDHNAYYHTLSNDIKGLPEEEYMDIDLNTIPLIIKTGASSKLERSENGFVEIDRFCSAYDLLPTVLDLLGIRFNKRLYIGNSLFGQIDDTFQNEYGENKELVVYYSLTGGLISESMYTLNMTDFHYDEFVTIEYFAKFKEVSCQTLQKLNYIYTLYVHNAYKYIIPVN